MVDRTVKVNLIAQVNGYLTGMAKAAAATRATGTEAEKLAAKKEAIGTLGTSLLAVGTLAAVGVGLAIKSFADFDAKLSQVQTLSHSTADEMNGLRDAALHMGQAIGFSATEVADAEIELVKAGISVKDVMGGALAGSLQLAAAGQINVADATEIATIAMTQFGLKGKDIPHVADLLSAGADKALGSVGDLGEALKSGGLVADQFGVSLDETVGTLSAFANAGLIGETAGTDLRQMLLKLAAPAADAAKTMADLGIEIYGTNGKFVGVSNLAGQLHDKLGGLSDAQRNAALATIFGSRAIAGANVLYKEGAKGISGWTNSVDDTGFAAQQAAGKMDNLKGDVSKLGAAFQTDLIESGGSVNGVLRTVVQSLTGLVAAVGNLPQPVLGAGLVLGGLTAAFALAGGTAFTMVPKIAAFKAGLVELKISGKAAGAGIGIASIAVAGLSLVLIGLAESNAKAQALTESYADTLDSTTLKITKSSREVAKADLAMRDSFAGITTESAYQGAAKLGVSLKTVTDAALGNVDALKKLKPLLDVNIVAKGSEEAKKAGLSYQEWSDAVLSLRGGVLQNNESIKDAIRIAKEKAKADGDATEGANNVAGSLEGVTSSAGDANNAVSDLAATLKGFGSATLDARAAQRDFQQAIDDAASSLKDNGHTLDINTQAGRDNQAALDKIASSANAASAAVYSQNQSVDESSAVLDAGRTALINAAAQYGLTGQAAQDYADKVLATPSEVQTSVTLIGVDKANADLTALRAQLIALDGSAAKYFSNAAVKALVGPGTGSLLAIPHKARGGILPGSPSARDNMLIAAASGEYVTNSRAASRPENRQALEFMNAGGNMSAWSQSAWPGTRSNGSAAGSIVVNPQVSLAGASITMMVDGRPITAIVQEQIVQSNTRKAIALQNGMQKGSL